jgi:hypothetical protein
VLIEPLRSRLSGPDADLRARLAAALAAGLLYALWVARDETLLGTDRTALVTHYGVLLQQVLTPAPQSGTDTTVETFCPGRPRGRRGPSTP